MTNTLDYGHRRSRRHWRVLAVALVLGVTTFFAVRAWRLHLARLEDRRLYEQQRAFRQQFDQQFQNAMLHPIDHATTRP